MKNFKSEKGITIVTLIVTIIILLILTTTIVIDTDTGSDYKNYKLMCADIELLEDKILLYFNKCGEIPTSDQVQNVPEEINNGHEFYKIDISKLNNVTLNYGTETDVYIIDSTTFEVYYLNGIEYEEVIYYTD